MDEQSPAWNLRIALKLTDEEVAALPTDYYCAVCRRSLLRVKRREGEHRLAIKVQPDTRLIVLSRAERHGLIECTRCGYRVPVDLGLLGAR